MSSRLIVQFAKAPRDGFVKTRMQPYLNVHEARSLHESLVKYCSRQLVLSGLANVQLWVDFDPGHALFQFCKGIGIQEIQVQCGSDLGERMFDCFRRTLSDYRSVVLVGSDCPDIDTDYLTAAFSALESVPLVFGPAFDGGYVLIGAKEINKELFQDIHWGRDSVLSQSKKNAKRLGFATKTLDALRDLDRPQDLEYYSDRDFIRR